MAKPMRALKAGEMVLMDGAVYEVSSVNFCRAVLHLAIPSAVATRDFVDGRTGKRVCFTGPADAQMVSVSPCAFLERV